MTTSSMIHTAQALVAPGKGILAADESAPTIAKRLAAVGLESTEPRAARTARSCSPAPGLGEHISGVILYDETSASGRPTARRSRGARRAGIIPGIKVDAGTRPLAGFPARWSPRASTGCATGSRSTPSLGARFAKWRAVIRIG